MRIALVSDTHMPRCARALPAALQRGLLEHRVELILHLGDFTLPEVPALFEAIAPLEAVAGNNDGADLVRRFGRRKILELDGLRIGMTHGDGRSKTTLERARDAFTGERLGLIAFGHSHMPYCARHGGVWLVNPGSPTDRRRAPLFSWCLLDVRDGAAEPCLQYYGDKRSAG